MDYKKLSRIIDSAGNKLFRYRVYYPGKNADKYDVEEFEADTDEKAKAAAEDFAANFKREEVIINKVTDSELPSIDNVVCSHSLAEFIDKLREIDPDKASKVEKETVEKFKEMYKEYES